MAACAALVALVHVFYQSVHYPEIALFTALSTTNDEGWRPVLSLAWDDPKHLSSLRFPAFPNEWEDFIVFIHDVSSALPTRILTVHECS
jgi:hypothetical protein